MACPNKSLQDWNDLVDKLGEDGAYYVFMKNGERVPYLQGRDSNRFIWDVENSLGLVTWKNENGKNTKLYKGFSRDKAADLVSQIRENYVGDYTISRPAPDTAGEFALQIKGYPLPKREVEDYMRKYDSEKAEAIKNVQLYKEFKEREEEANEDIIPLSAYEQKESLYNNTDTPANKQEAFNEAQQEDLKTILQATMPDVEIVEDQRIEGIAELRPGKIIAVNSNKLLNSTFGHEFGHLMIDLRGGLGNSFIQEAYEQLKDTELADRVREAYKGESEEQIQKEIVAEAIGLETADIFSREQDKSKFEKWLIRLFRWLGARLGITKNNARELASEMLKGKPLPTQRYAGKQAKTVQKQLPMDDITEEEQAQQQPAMRLTAEENRILDQAEKIRNKATDIISTRLRKLSRSGAEGDISTLQDLLHDLESSEVEDQRAVIQFTANAVEYINKIYRDYETAKAEYEKGNAQAFNLKTAARWNDVMTSYDLLDNIVSLVVNEGLGPNFPGFYKSTTKKYKQILEDAVSKKNAVKTFFQEKGADMATDILTMYSTRVITTTRNEKRREWAKNNKDKAKNMTMAEKEAAEKEYAEEYIEKNIQTLEKETKALIRSEMEEASEDVGLLTRYLDTLLDTNDTVVAAAVKLFVTKEREARTESLAYRDKAWGLVQKLYEDANYKYMSTPLHDVYDFMLEKIDGKRTGYLISKFSSALMDEYRKVIRDAQQYPEAKAYAMRKKWKDENMPLDRVAMFAALNKYFDELKKQGAITDQEVSAFNLNQERPFRDRLKTSDVIRNTETANAVDKWFRENAMEFRTPSKKWENPKWKEWADYMDKNPNSPKTQFYKLITETIADIDSVLPYNKRKFKQLPFQFKDSDERIAAGQKVGTVLKDYAKDLTVFREDDVDKGEYTDENDQPLNYIPWHYRRPGNTVEHEFEYQVKYSNGKLSNVKTMRLKADTGEEAIAKFKKLLPDAVNMKPKGASVKEWTDEEQSYDLMGLYYDYVKMANKHVAMTEILPVMEETKRIVTDRKYTARDASGNPIMKVMQGVNQRNLTREGVNSNLSAMFGDFMKAQMYGQTKEDEGSWDVMGWKFDKAKMADMLGKYSSYTMLGMNLVQAVANVNVGELTQLTEAIAGEYLTVKDLHKATVEYAKEMKYFLGDIGQPIPLSKLGKLNEKWDILNEYDGGNYKKNSRFAHMMNSSVLFFMSHMGEHFMQSRIMMAMLSKIEAKDKDGKVIGNMLDMYHTTESGELKLNPEVNLENSNWTPQEQELFGMKVKTLLSRLHGQYSDLGKNAAQRWTWGRLAMMFRKFVVPGFKRRWEKRKVNEFLEEEVEGSYRAMFSFLNTARKELRAVGLSAMSENWNEMSTKDQRNIIRGASELGLATMMAIFATGFLALKGETDDDDLVLGTPLKQQYVYGLMAYLALRVKSEMFFFANPAETLTILRSPAVATSVIESIIKLIGQVLVPTAGWELYERGSWEGKPKIFKTMTNLVPVAKQIHKTINIEDSLTFFLH